MDAVSNRQVKLNRGRSAVHRKYRRLHRAIQVLIECGVLVDHEIVAESAKKLELLKSKWLKENLKSVPASRPGRPKSGRNVETSEKCAKQGCQNPCAPEQKYCCRRHAPYGYYGLPHNLE